MTIKAVGMVWKTSGEDGDGWRSVEGLVGFDGSTPVMVNVKPGTGEGGNVGIAKLVAVGIG